MINDDYSSDDKKLSSDTLFNEIIKKIEEKQEDIELNILIDDGENFKQLPNPLTKYKRNKLNSHDFFNTVIDALSNKEDFYIRQHTIEGGVVGVSFNVLSKIAGYRKKGEMVLSHNSSSYLFGLFPAKINKSPRTAILLPKDIIAINANIKSVKNVIHDTFFSLINELKRDYGEVDYNFEVKDKVGIISVFSKEHTDIDDAIREIAQKHLQWKEKQMDIKNYDDNTTSISILEKNDGENAIVAISPDQTNILFRDALGNHFGDERIKNMLKIMKFKNQKKNDEVKRIMKIMEQHEILAKIFESDKQFKIIPYAGKFVDISGTLLHLAIKERDKNREINDLWINNVPQFKRIDIGDDEVYILQNNIIKTNTKLTKFTLIDADNSLDEHVYKKYESSIDIGDYYDDPKDGRLYYYRNNQSNKTTKKGGSKRTEVIEVPMFNNKTISVKTNIRRRMIRVKKHELERFYINYMKAQV